MSSRLQLDMRNLSLGRRHLVNAYEVEAGIGVIAGNTVWSMPERLECEVLQKVRYINTLTYTYPTYWCLWRNDRCAGRRLVRSVDGVCQRVAVTTRSYQHCREAVHYWYTDDRGRDLTSGLWRLNPLIATLKRREESRYC